MADKLADYVVGVGIKGQNVALTEINKIKKAGKELSKMKAKVNLRSEISTRKQLDVIKKQTQATRGQVELQKMQDRNQSQFAQKIRGGAQTGANTASTFLSGGDRGIVQSLPAIGGLFAAANSSIEAAAAQYVSGVVARKNINLVTTNYAKAFSDAFSNGTRIAVTGGMFGARETQNFYADLVGQGANASTFTAENQKLLDDVAKAQGVGSLSELFQRIQSGTLKEGKEFGGFTKTDKDILAGQGDLLNSQYTMQSGLEGILNTFRRRRAEISAAGVSGQRLYDVSATEGRIRETEESDQDAISAALAPSYADMRTNRFRDARSRARNQGLNRRVNQIGNAIADEGSALLNDVLSGNFRRAAARLSPGGGAGDPSIVRERLDNAVASGAITRQEADATLQRMNLPLTEGTSPSNADAPNRRLQRFSDETERATDAMRNFSNNANSYGRGVNTDTGY